MDGSEEEVIAGFQNLEFQSGGHRRLQLLIQLVDTGVHLRRIGARSLEHHVYGTGFTINVRGVVIAHSTDFHICHIAQVHHVSAVARAQHNVVEFLDGFQRTFVFH